MSPALWPSFLPPREHGDDARCLVSARGVRLRFADGSTALCGTSGLWNTNLGYGNQHITEALAKALDRSSYLGTFRWENAPIREAAERLCLVAGEPFTRVLFSTSGGAANDLAMKVARQHHAIRGRGDRKLIVGLRGGYHGLTFGAFALTSDDLGQQQYGVDRRLVRHLEPNDVALLKRMMARCGDQVAAVVVEPVLGTGAVELTREWLSELVRQRDEHGFLLVADEVATGFGRVGESYFASQEWPGEPDLLITSKALTNGTCAAAAVLVADHVWESFRAHDVVLGHAETQAGTAVTGAAINATLDEMAAQDALSAGRMVSERLDHHLAQLLADEESVVGIRGRGCFRAVSVVGPEGAPLSSHGVQKLVAHVRRAGAVVHPGPSGLQLVPALVYTAAETEELFARIREGMARARHHMVAA